MGNFTPNRPCWGLQSGSATVAGPLWCKKQLCSKSAVLAQSKRGIFTPDRFFHSAANQTTVPKNCQCCIDVKWWLCPKAAVLPWYKWVLSLKTAVSQWHYLADCTSNSLHYDSAKTGCATTVQKSQVLQQCTFVPQISRLVAMQNGWFWCKMTAQARTHCWWASAGPQRRGVIPSSHKESLCSGTAKQKK